MCCCGDGLLERLKSTGPVSAREPAVGEGERDVVLRFWACSTLCRSRMLPQRDLAPRGRGVVTPETGQ